MHSVGKCRVLFRLDQVVHVVNKCALEDESADNVAPHIIGCTLHSHQYYQAADPLFVL
jgi:hypothetical protein